MLMHIHILGICGTFMGSLAILAQQAGYTVSGQDNKFYPPMSTQLVNCGIDIIEGFNLVDVPADIDIYVVGNIMSRGMPIIEALLNSNALLLSGPEFLAKYILKDKKVIAVSGTHGKTTTTTIITHILKHSGKQPGYLIGGVPQNFEFSAYLGDGDLFVIEADEYDCAFFDKRSKFFHYKPTCLVISNIEYDHADIFKDLQAILTQFHYLLRTMPGNCSIVFNQDCPNIAQLFAMGVWSKQLAFGNNKAANFNSQLLSDMPPLLSLAGEHNRYNMLAAIAAVSVFGISSAQAIEALHSFAGVKRRLELKFSANNYKVYSDFAHHPTAIQSTIAGLAAMLPSNSRLISIVDLGSNSMKLGIHQDTLPACVSQSSKNYFFHQGPLSWPLPNLYTNREELLQQIMHNLQPNDTILLMTNGAFANFIEDLTCAIDDLAKVSY
jgi:UDP-N-acetylmuramate: L-alanyl-gamma-D-glutamyl-meso-diaminopimelate ligase